MTDFLSEVGEVSSVCPIRGPGAELRGRLWGKSHAFLSSSSGSRVQIVGGPHLLTAQVSYWTAWEYPRVSPLLAANALVKSRWRELLLCQCPPLSVKEQLSCSVRACAHPFSASSKGFCRGVHLSAWKAEPQGCCGSSSVGNMPGVS